MIIGMTVQRWPVRIFQYVRASGHVRSAYAPKYGKQQWNWSLHVGSQTHLFSLLSVGIFLYVDFANIPWPGAKREGNLRIGNLAHRSSSKWLQKWIHFNWVKFLHALHRTPHVSSLSYPFDNPLTQMEPDNASLPFHLSRAFVSRAVR